MPYAIELFLDGTTDGLVREVWKKYAEAGISDYLSRSDSRPHITLAVFERLTLEQCQDPLNRFVAEHHFPELEFSHLGVFYSEKNVVFVAPTVTPELLELHRKFHRQFEPLMEQEWESYREGRWVPHCTLGVDLPKDKIAQAVQCSLTLSLPFRCRVVEVALIEFRPVRQICACRLDHD
jgi:2'-5' RNA ligase